MLNGRNILIGVTLAAAIALPFLVREAMRADERYLGHKAELRQVQAELREVARFEQHLERYRDYVHSVGSFVAAADRHGVGAGRFDTHEVDIKDMSLAWGELQGFIDDLDSGDGSFFIPEKMTLTSQPTVTRDDLATGSLARAEPGGLRISVKGRFLVER